MPIPPDQKAQLIQFYGLDPSISDDALNNLMASIDSFNTSMNTPIAPSADQQAYAAQMQGMGFNTLLQNGKNPGLNPGGQLPYDPSAQAALGASPWAFNPYVDPTYQAFANISDNPASGSNGVLGNVVADPTWGYQLVDHNTGKVLYSGTGLDALKAAQAQAQQLSADPAASWDLQTQQPGSTGWTTSAQDRDVRDPFLAQLIKFGAIGGIGAGLISGLAPLAGIGSSAPAATGATGAGAGAGGATGAAAGATGAAASSAIPAALGDIVVTGTVPTIGAGTLAGLGGLGAVGGALAAGSGGAAAAPAAAAASPPPVAQPGDIVVTGSAPGAGLGVPATALGIGGMASLGSALASLPTPIPNQTVPAKEATPTDPAANSDIYVDAKTLPPPTGPVPTPSFLNVFGDLALPSTAALAASALSGAAPTTTTPADTPTPDITVTGTPPSSILNLPDLAIPSAAALAAGALSGATPTVSTASTTSPTDRLITALKAAGLISSAIGGSGIGGSGTATWNGGNPSLSPIFSAKLPTANLPGSSTGDFSARQMPAQDWNVYATRPEQSFFNNVPSTYTPPPPGQTDPNWDHKAAGGLAVKGAPTPGPSHVAGPGDGRSDSIPSMLSDGEYVMDAETVSLLGNGSNKAGADKLNQFRVNLRKQKGKQLAKGKFSLSAKAPEAYMAGAK